MYFQPSLFFFFFYSVPSVFGCPAAGMEGQKFTGRCLHLLY